MLKIDGKKHYFRANTHLKWVYNNDLISFSYSLVDHCFRVIDPSTVVCRTHTGKIVERNNAKTEEKYKDKKDKKFKEEMSRKIKHYHDNRDLYDNLEGILEVDDCYDSGPLFGRDLRDV
jgi:hypothetical protein